jgi:hypothetical protein
MLRQHWKPRDVVLRFARSWARIAVAGVLLVSAGACSDATAPGISAADATPSFSQQIDWFSCHSGDGGWSWSCQYTGSTGGSSSAFPYVTGAGSVRAPSNCSYNASPCTNEYTGGGGGGSSNPVPTSGSRDLASGYCLQNSLCSPKYDQAAADEVCADPEVAEMCAPPQERPFAAVKLVTGVHGGLIGCPSGGTMTWSGPGRWEGLPARYDWAVRKIRNIGAVGGFDELAYYGFVTTVMTGSGIGKYGGPILVNCRDGTYIGVAFSK